MGNEDDRRDRPRMTIAVPVRLFDSTQRLLLNARTLDLSTVGALLHGNCPAQVGDSVQVEVDRGTARNPLRLEAEVIRFAEPDDGRRTHGVAVRFVGVSPLDETLLKSIILDARA